jgi:hypothetical protein
MVAMVRFFDFFFNRNGPSAIPEVENTTPHSDRAIFDSVCNILKQALYEELAALQAKIKTLELIQQTDPLSPKIEDAWKNIRQKADNDASAAAELLIEMQNLLHIGRSSKLW